ncbi:putative DNA-binding domain-containing protein [Chitinibacter fontanus]|uniref:Putative DNA-binding domain-containing protein n=1 Tax=Chitinibacter fontanus TaxID=1737446 RepID=A0A7D5ZHN7_9NEIS|nr:DNA-binding domain-containing protein [Chitinibacter fontanus]QLI82528.1 putative DNA-binding domain-containing protein [Chitinibacter fontanus]
MNYAQGIAAFASLLLDPQAAEDGLHFPARMRHYRANCRLNRIAALQGVFSNVAQLVGEDFFTAMAREYVDVTPANSADLHAMGDDFADFIGQFAPAADLPYLADVARVDWARWRAYLAPDEATLGLLELAQLAAADFASMQLRFHPSLQLVQSPHWPIADILAMHAGGTVAQLASGGQQILISRSQWQVISLGQWTFLQSLSAGHCVGEALDHALQIDEACDIQSTLNILFTQQLLRQAVVGYP